MPGFGVWASKFALWAWQTIGLRLTAWLENFKYWENRDCATELVGFWLMQNSQNLEAYVKATANKTQSLG